MIKKLRIKFVCINMTIVTAMLGVIFSLLIFFVGMAMEIQGRQAIQEITEAALHSDRRLELRQEVRRPYFLVRIGFDGSILAIDRGYFEEMDQETLLEYTAAVLDAEKSDGTLLQHRLRYQVLSAPFGRTIIFADISGEMATMENLMKISLVIAVLSFGLFLIISVLLAAWAVKPVEAAWNRQRQFVADASHELKTPLTVIMTNAELLQSSDYSEEARSRFAGSILTMSRQMRGLVESLLELARLDNGATRMSFSLLDLSELVSEGLLPFEPVYFERELVLESGIEEGICVKGSLSHLRQVLDILLDNGAKYSYPGGQVLVRLKRQGSTCLLSVATPGENISRADLEQIFERFYRIDKVRAMDHSYGLGLSIARSIVAEHGGRIWAESEGGVNTFFVQLPVV